ncbi:hypothetical protein [Streptomyces sp. ISL-100]|uniref:hypothetical protein n=1 Tax=Streptomyces sp. ISL-100 TaxID=2819173 RepID=UPI001BECA905|nr:hypothetical protein [Streptomyces sp. ISL-100]MBT2399651.1 hypothetical protein [Streptomyces sp. ISL-100]
MSGMAVVEGAPVGRDSADVVVVRDNKDDGQDRVVTVRLRPGKEPVTKALEWEGPLPKDLEALDAIPGRKNHYIAVASEGTAYHIAVAGDTVTVLGRPVPLPGKVTGDNYESFAVFRHPSGKLTAVWATRGNSEEKSVVRAAAMTIGQASLRIGMPAGTQEFAVPFPTEDEVRHVSDLKVLPDGTVLIASASDPNTDDGPFSSALYSAGKLSMNRGLQPVLHQKKGSLTPLRRFTKQDDRKIEAVAQLPNKQEIWGTDDENHGGFVRFDQVRP